jgi:organic hydroperoxide reductase OsmC/OhrA
MERQPGARQRHHVSRERSIEGPYPFASRFEEGDGTNPEELIAAAHAGCFSMQLAALLSQAGHQPCPGWIEIGLDAKLA